MLVVVLLVAIFSLILATYIAKSLGPSTFVKPMFVSEIADQRCAIKKKTIWLLWMQGWNDQTPWIVKQVRGSWEGFNRDWDVVALDAKSLGTYLDISEGTCVGNMIRNGVPAAAISDMIRLSLLHEHGGVWADATMLCLHPLDDWVYEAMLPCGFWMYHGRNHGEGPASWFMISTRHSYITKKWRQASQAAWENAGFKSLATNDYFWMDGIFMDLQKKDPEFQKEWEKVPYLWCESFGQAHMFAGITEELCSEEIKELMRYSPPFAIKLSHHSEAARSGLGLNFRDTNLWHAVAASRKRQEMMPPREIEAALSSARNSPLIRGDPGELPEFDRAVLVIADCGCADSTAMILDMCLRHSITPLFYDKCSFCTRIPDGTYSRPLKNVGRDLHTFCWFAARYYDHLPHTIYFSAGNMKKHNRAARLEMLITGNASSAADMEATKNFEITEHEGVKLRPATARPMKEWYEKFVGDWDSSKTAAICYNAILRTTSEKIRRRKRCIYVNLCKELELTDGEEAGHFMERAFHSVFALE